MEFNEERFALEVALITLILIAFAFLYKVCSISGGPIHPTAITRDLEETLHGQEEGVGNGEPSREVGSA